MRFLFWNIKQFNLSADGEDRQVRHRQRIQMIADTVRHLNADIVGFVELRSGVATPGYDTQYDEGGGTWALRHLAVSLGSPWQFIVSGGNAMRDRGKGELYGFVFDGRAYIGPDTVSLLNSDRSAKEIEFQNRVPGYARFTERLSGNTYDIILLHAPKPSDDPEETIGLMHLVREIADADRMIVAGDFNTGDDTAFAHIRGLGFQFAVRGKSSYATSPDGASGSALSSAYDAILFKGLHQIGGGVYDYVAHFTEGDSTRQQLRTARSHYTDHAAVWGAFRYPRREIRSATSRVEPLLPRQRGFLPNVKRCSICNVVHGRIPSVAHLWHRCTNTVCGAVYCGSCGKNLTGKRWLDPRRNCVRCGNRTEMISL